MHDQINSPKHYTQGNIEVIDFIEDQGLGYHAGNVIKYVSRYRYKNGLEDLKKARWYLDRLIESIERQDARCGLPISHVYNECENGHDCLTCKYEALSTKAVPCMICLYSVCQWEPKEEK